MVLHHSGCGRNIGFLYTLLAYNLTTCMVMQLFMPQRIYGLRIDKRHDMRQFLGMMIWENGNSAHIYVHTLKLWSSVTTLVDFSTTHYLFIYCSQMSISNWNISNLLLVESERMIMIIRLDMIRFFNKRVICCKVDLIMPTLKK